MNCPHCKFVFEPESTGLVDCPACHKPVFVRPPVNEEEVPAEVAQEEEVAPSAEAEAVDAAVKPTGEEAPETPEPTESDNREQPVKRVVTMSLEEFEALASEVLQHGRVVECVPAWERRDLSFGQRFLGTVKAVAIKPAFFFSTLPWKFDRRPLFFSYIMWLLYFAVSFGMQYYMITHNQASMIANLPDGGLEVINQAFGGLDQLAYFTLMLFAGSPLWAFLPPILLALFLQVFLWLFRIDNRGYSQALRVVCYSSASLLLVLLPPIFGAAALAYLSVFSLAVAFAYRSRFMLAFPLALLTAAAGGLILVDIISLLAQLMASVQF